MTLEKDDVKCLKIVGKKQIGASTLLGKLMFTVEFEPGLPNSTV